MYCENCGTENEDEDKFCKACGQPLNNNVNTTPTTTNPVEKTTNPNSEKPYSSGVVYKQKSMALAIILSILISGTGLMYSGAVVRGVVTLIITIVCGLLFLPIGVIIGIIQIVDTYYAIKQVNAGEKPLFLGSYDFLTN